MIASNAPISVSWDCTVYFCMNTLRAAADLQLLFTSAAAAAAAAAYLQWPLAYA